MSRWRMYSLLGLLWQVVERNPLRDTPKLAGDYRPRAIRWRNPIESPKTFLALSCALARALK
jgi:hypothetical protein